MTGRARAACHALGLQPSRLAAELGFVGEPIVKRDPTTDELLVEVAQATRAGYDAALAAAAARFSEWRLRPAPRRGELIRGLGERLRQHKQALGELVSLEVGKIRSEGLGEIQEMIDICDFAVGLSRQLHGLTIASERPAHRLLEQWHPLGTIGIVTAFNFPAAVWAWNAALAAVCGDVCVWKPSPQTPLVSLAIQQLCREVEAEHDARGLFQLVLGGAAPAEWLADDRRVPLLSFTGSTRVGRLLAAQVAGRLGRSLLELGGNNAVIVLADADLDLAVRAITFGAVGTTGQRCTTTRRLYVDGRVLPELRRRLLAAYQSLHIGDPLEEGVLVGPLVGARGVEAMQAALAAAKAEGGRVLCGGELLPRAGHFVTPAIVESDRELAVAREETFAPILYLREVADLEAAIAANNAVDHGLSSALFTDSVRAAERFLSAAGSDCGIANVNLGTSGAEIGGAFGGEKDTGGGRESGSDAWRAYMRRQTCTINGGRDLPLAQGVVFG